MARAWSRLSAILVIAGSVSAACGGKVVVDVAATSMSTGEGAGGAATAASSTQGAGAGEGATGGGGCDSASHTIDFADYNLSCNVAEDCVAVFLGDFCMLCSCPFSAINVADKMKWEAEAELKAAGTPPDTCSCPASTPICDQGQCATTVP
jgi:hypothetical protein